MPRRAFRLNERMDSIDPAADADDRDRVLGECLDDFTRRRGLGEPVSVEDYRARLGEDFGEFLETVATTDLLDSVLTLRPVAPAFPRAFGRYTLLAQLGRGSVGVVYDAQDRELGRRVALKVLRPGFDTDPAAVERFRGEARHCALVRHPSIVVVHEAGLLEGQHYYTMERVEGHTLASLVKRDRDPALPPAPALPALLRGLADVADALGALHAADAVHRDVKPSNLMVRPDGRFVLADFGLARTVDSVRMTRTGQMMGTLLYSSPEQVLGRRDAVDARSDVYGLGASLYEAVCGRPPFDTEDAGELMKRILEQRPAPPSEVAAKDPVRGPVPESVDRVVLKCLEKRPEDRYPTMAALRADLLAVAGGREPEGRPVGAVRRVVRKRGRLMSIAGAFALVAGGATYWNRTRPVDVALYSYPSGALVLEGDAPLGLTDTVVALSRGRHRLRVRRDGFRELEWVVDVPWDGRTANRAILVPADATNPRDSRDPRVHKAYAEDAAGVHRMRPLPADDRAAPEGRLRALWPTGDVALDELGQVAFELDPLVLLDAERIVVECTVNGGPDRPIATLAPGRDGEPVLVSVPAGLLSDVTVGAKVVWRVRALRPSGLADAESVRSCVVVASEPLEPSVEPAPDAGIPAAAHAAARAIAMVRAGRPSLALSALAALRPAQRSLYTEMLLAEALARVGLLDTRVGVRCRRAWEAARSTDPGLVEALSGTP